MRSFPENCLLIYRGNFTKFFGDAFRISAALAVSKDLNWNFETRETLKKKHKLGDKEVDQILENMPYRSYDDLIQKVPAMSTKNLDKETGFLPYQDFQPEKKAPSRINFAMRLIAIRPQINLYFRLKPNVLFHILSSRHFCYIC
jgi:hypothetical protein